MLNKSLTLTIVIPVYNEEGYLAACLDAIASQSVLADEIIVVDNNSTDATLNIVRQYDFVTLLHEPRQGVLYARNTGFNKASSDIIGRIDADTVLSKDWVKNVKESLGDSSASAITGPVSYYDMPLARSNYHIDHFMRRSIYNWSPKSPFLFGSNMAIKRSAWHKTKANLCSDSYMHEDLDLAIHLDRIGHRILYDLKLLSGTSGRRYNDSLGKFYVYLSMYRQTYLRHNLHCLAIYSATGIYWLGYAILHPWRKLWFSLSVSVDPLLALKRAARKNPMSNL